MWGRQSFFQPSAVFPMHGDYVLRCNRDNAARQHLVRVKQLMTGHFDGDHVEVAHEPWGEVLGGLPIPQKVEVRP
ncbi:hypothetical protein B5V46_03460 [Rhodovulum sp. MB263]|nr:hypothetical protein B5V46_03460 [Rhodovulum sp. MB263]